MNLVCVQFDIIWESKEANFRKVRALLDLAGVEAGSLIVLPEMFSTGFSMNVERICESAAGETESFLAEMAKAHQSHVLGGVVNRDPNGLGRNEAVVFDPAGLEAARYCKMHPFSFAGEHRHYVSGPATASFAWGAFTVAPFICYDLRFPEIFRLAAARGADLLVVIACWPRPREAHWLALLKARAIENQAYVAGVNRVGADPKAAYSGRSLIIDPRGNVIADASNGETVIQAQPDRAALEAWRREFPALADMRHVGPIADGQ